MPLDAHTIALRFLQKLPDVMLDFHVLDEALSSLKSDLSVPHMLIAERNLQYDLLLQDFMRHPYLVSGYGDQQHIDLYLAYYRPFDPWDQFERECNLNRACVSSQYSFGQVRRNSPFHEWLTPIDIQENATIKLYDHPQGWLGMNLHFNSKHADTETVVRVMNLIQQPLSRVLYSSFNGLSKGGIVDVVHPVFEIDATHRFIFVNNSAEEFLQRHADILLDGDRFVLSDSRDNRCFKKAVEEVLQTRSPQMMTVLLGDCNRVHLCLSIDERITNDKIRVDTLVRITVVTGVTRNPAIPYLAKAHGLNNTQTQILHYTAQGMNTDDIAASLNLKTQSVREQRAYLYRVLDVKNRQPVGLATMLHEYARILKA